MRPDRANDALTILLTEYEQLKEEQRSRIGFRDNLLYVTLVSIGAVGFTALQSGFAVLLVLPALTFVLGWNYLSSDQKVQAIGTYIRTELSPSLFPMVPQLQGLPFGWEFANQNDPTRATRKAMWLAVDLMVFCLSPAVALGIHWIQWGSAVSWRGAMLLAVSVVEVAVTAVLAFQIMRQAGLIRSRRKERG